MYTVQTLIKFIPIAVQPSAHRSPRTLFILQNWNSTPIELQLPIPRQLQPLVTTTLLSMNLTVPGTSRESSYIFFLAYFT